MDGSGRAPALLWSLTWVVVALIFYFFVSPIGIKVPSYATQSPALFPNTVALFIATLGVVQFASDYFSKKPARVEPFSPLFFFVPLVAGIYALLFKTIGFPLLSAVTLAVLLLVFGERRPAVIALLSVLTSAAVYLTFVYALRIPLPGGIVR